MKSSDADFLRAISDALASNGFLRLADIAADKVRQLEATAEVPKVKTLDYNEGAANT